MELDEMLKSGLRVTTSKKAPRGVYRAVTINHGRPCGRVITKPLALLYGFTARCLVSSSKPRIDCSHRQTLQLCGQDSSMTSSRRCVGQTLCHPWARMTTQEGYP